MQLQARCAALWVHSDIEIHPHAKPGLLRVKRFGPLLQKTLLYETQGPGMEGRMEGMLLEWWYGAPF